MKKRNTLTAKNLKDQLWETLNGVKSKTVTPTQANAIAAQSREIIRVIRTELAVMTLSGRKPGAAASLLK